MNIITLTYTQDYTRYTIYIYVYIFHTYIYIYTLEVCIWYQQPGLLPMSGFGWCLATCHERCAFQPSSRGTRDRFTHVHIMYSLIVALQCVSLCFTFYNIQMCLSILLLKVHTFFCSDTLNSYVFLNIQYIQYIRYIQYIQIHTSSVQFALYIVIFSFLHIRNIQNIMFTFYCEKDSRIGR